MDSVSPANRVLSTVRRAPAAIFAAIRHAVARVFQAFFRDQVRDLNRQTERLGSASVESAAYLSLELQALDQRLSRIENDVARLRDAVASGEPPR